MLQANEMAAGFPDEYLCPARAPGSDLMPHAVMGLNSGGISVAWMPTTGMAHQCRWVLLARRRA